MKRKREENESHEQSSAGEDESASLVRNPESLTRSVSPPALRRNVTQSKSITAQVEAGEKDVEDHLTFFSSKLQAAARPYTLGISRLDHQSWVNLYEAHVNNPAGHHFVIHQHDHPVAGTHYDLRLQCNATSSVSWAIMYGLPGDPNSRRLNRNATETRIHCLWNHLIETASHQTGTLLIWDTGVYEVLPYRENHEDSEDTTTNDEISDLEKPSDPASLKWNLLSQQGKLHRAFQERRIRVRLHGTRLPTSYTISLWLRREHDRTEQPAAPKTRRKKGSPGISRRSSRMDEYNTDSERERGMDTDGEDDTSSHTRLKSRPGSKVSSLDRHEPPPTPLKPEETQPLTALSRRSHHSQSAANAVNNPSPKLDRQLSAYRRSQIQPQVQKPDHDSIIQLTNAYPGAINTINSIHQRKWYLTLDRQNSGFVKSTSQSRPSWIPRLLSSDPPLHSQPKLSHKDNGSTNNAAKNRSRDLSTRTSNDTIPQGFEPFYVRGRDHEISVITGRLARDILHDEGVVGFVPRAGWSGVVE